MMTGEQVPRALLRKVPAGGGTLDTLIRNAHARGAVLDAVRWLVEASKFCPAFASPGEAGSGGGRILQLASGKALPKLVCVPSYLSVAGSGPEQFIKFAGYFEGKRDVLACSLPGLDGSDLPPGAWDTLIEVLRDSIRRAVGDAPFVLVGYSIGGAIADDIAAGLEEEGVTPAGVVLLDTTKPEVGGESPDILAVVMNEIVSRSQGILVIDDANWLAMGTYLSLTRERPQRPQAKAKTLLIRAGVPLGGQGTQLDWPAWEVGDEQAEVATDHTALNEAPGTAEAIEKWIVTNK